MSTNKPDPLRDGRSASEVIFKTLAIRIATSSAVGHLTTLRRTPDCERSTAEAEVVGFLVFPTLPIASTVYHTWATARLALRHWQGKVRRPSKGFAGNARFYISACLGGRAVISPGGAEQPEGTDAIFLHHIISSDRLSSKSGQFSSRWLARLIILLALLAQAAATSILGMHRCMHPKALTPTDLRNMYMAFGGGWAALESILLTLINRDWYFDRHVPDFAGISRRRLGITIGQELYDFRLPSHPIIPQLRLASWAFKILNLALWCVFSRQRVSLEMENSILETYWPRLYDDSTWDITFVISQILTPFMGIDPLFSLEWWAPIGLVFSLSAAALTTLNQHGPLTGVSRMLRELAISWDILEAAAVTAWFILDLKIIARARRTGYWQDVLWQDDWSTFLWAF